MLVRLEPVQHVVDWVLLLVHLRLRQVTIENLHRPNLILDDVVIGQIKVEQDAIHVVCKNF